MYNIPRKRKKIFVVFCTHRILLHSFTLFTRQTFHIPKAFALFFLPQWKTYFQKMQSPLLKLIVVPYPRFFEYREGCHSDSISGCIFIFYMTRWRLFGERSDHARMSIISKNGCATSFPFITVSIHPGQAVLSKLIHYPH